MIDNVTSQHPAIAELRGIVAPFKGMLPTVIDEWIARWFVTLSQMHVIDPEVYERYPQKLEAEADEIAMGALANEIERLLVVKYPAMTPFRPWIGRELRYHATILRKEPKEPA